VPIIVAINKIDKPNVQLERIQKELADRNVISEEWGGDTLFVKVSAKTGEGLDLLLENILLQAEVLDLKAPPSGPASGVVLEAKLDKSRGVAATLLVQSGCLKTTDWIVAGTTLGRVRAMFNDKNQSIKEAYPSTPIEILGLNQVPQAGDIFTCVANESIAKEAVEYRLRKLKEKLVENSKPSVENMFAQMQSIAQDTLNIIIKADTHGSAEALRASILKLQTPEIKTHIVHWAVGGITETDVQLAHASKACIFGFSVRPDKQAALLAERDHITCETYTIIYELIDRIKELMSGRLSPTKQEKVLGRAEIRNIFSVPKIGNIAGVSVLDGKIVRSSQIRVIRDGTIVYTGKISSLKRFKDDAKEVLQGFECGLGVENFNDLKLGDIFESFTIEDHKTALGI
jgi:translation initiation factor IF-2